MSTINNLPTFIYVPMLVIVIIVLSALLIINHKSYPMPYNISFCFIIAADILLIILKLQLFNQIRSIIIIFIFLLSAIGFSILFISGYRYNKRNGIKMDPLLKKIFISVLIVVIICIILLAFILYMKNR